METSSPHTPAQSLQPDADPAAPDDPTAAAWARARAWYLSGEPATVVAARLGVSERTVQRRALKERWRRRDQPRMPMNFPDCLLDWEPDDPESPLNQFTAITDRAVADLLIDPNMGVCMQHAFRRAAECAATGRVVEALHWTRLTSMLQRMMNTYPQPGGVFTTPDRMRAAYGEAVRAIWGEENWPANPPWPTGPASDPVGDVGRVGEESE